MGAREKAREEAAFMRGDVGVDGAATQQEERDAADVERDAARDQLLRGRTWLGREFLAWLLWRSEAGEPLVHHEGESAVVLFLGRIVLRGLHAEVVELSAKGTLAPYSPQVRRALAEGLLPHSARMRLSVGERSWEATLDAEFLDLRSAKLPELLTEEEDDRLTERLDLAQQLSDWVDRLFQAFLMARAGARWSRDTVPAMRAWMEGAAQGASTVAERAQRVAS